MVFSQQQEPYNLTLRNKKMNPHYEKLKESERI